MIGDAVSYAKFSKRNYSANSSMASTRRPGAKHSAARWQDMVEQPSDRAIGGLRSGLGDNRHTGPIKKPPPLDADRPGRTRLLVFAGVDLANNRQRML